MIVVVTSRFYSKLTNSSPVAVVPKGKKQAIVSNSEMLLDNEVRLRFSLGSTCQQDKIVTVRK